jgi:DNA-binding LytR/AlgR family response regulator
MRFQLVVSDIVMVGPMDGIGLAHALRRRWPGTPIVLVTGYSSSATAAELEFTVLRKPFELLDLSRTMAKAIAEAGPDNVIQLQQHRRASERQKASDDEGPAGGTEQDPDVPA